MNSLLHLLGTFGQILQNQLFPRLKEELGELSEHHEQFVRALALLQMDGFVAVRHTARDASAIEVREKPGPKPPAAPAARRPHRKAGAAKRPEQMTRLERQCSGTMTVPEMLADVPRKCDIGCKLDSRGNKYRWAGYKLHLDVGDGQIHDQVRVELRL